MIDKIFLAIQIFALACCLIFFVYVYHLRKSIEQGKNPTANIKTQSIKKALDELLHYDKRIIQKGIAENDPFVTNKKRVDFSLKWFLLNVFLIIVTFLLNQSLFDYVISLSIYKLQLVLSLTYISSLFLILFIIKSLNEFGVYRIKNTKISYLFELIIFSTFITAYCITTVH